MARPKWEPPDLKIVEKMASQGLSQRDIAAALGISEDTLGRRKKDNADFAAAIKKGKALGITTVTSELMKQIKAGNTTAAIFFLKTQAGWKETTVLELPPDKKLEDMSDEELLAIIQGRKI